VRNVDNAPVLNSVSVANSFAHKEKGSAKFVQHWGEGALANRELISDLVRKWSWFVFVNITQGLCGQI
jgi:hypothetical protein